MTSRELIKPFTDQLLVVTFLFGIVEVNYSNLRTIVLSIKQLSIKFGVW